MKTVILCNRLNRLKAMLSGTSGPLRYVNLKDHRESFRICDYLRQRPETEELSRAKLLRASNRAFREKYTRFVGQLNARNHSLHWWAMSFTNKNPFSSALCRDTAHFLLIVSLCRASTVPLLVITDSVELTEQVAVWARSENLPSERIVSDPRPYRRFLK